MSDSSTIRDAEQATAEVADLEDQAAGVMRNVRSELQTQADDRARSFSGTLDDVGRQLVDMVDGNGVSDSQVSQLVRSAGDTVSQRAGRLDEDCRKARVRRGFVGARGTVFGASDRHVADRAQEVLDTVAGDVARPGQRATDAVTPPVQDAVERVKSSQDSVSTVKDDARGAADDLRNAAQDTADDSRTDH